MCSSTRAYDARAQPTPALAGRPFAGSAGVHIYIQRLSSSSSLNYSEVAHFSTRGKSKRCQCEYQCFGSAVLTAYAIPLISSRPRWAGTRRATYVFQRINEPCATNCLPPC